MLDAVHELGLVPHEAHGTEGYHAFAKYRDLAHNELADPNSPFTKLFNRHKADISRVPNPQEHLKNSLLPMFKYLAHHGKNSETKPSENSEPIDLLHAGYTPFDEAGSNGFEYKPETPSGFVEVPQATPKAGKKKVSPIRHDVYKSIAEHSDMGWSAPSKLKDYLVGKHGISPQEAATHIANWRRRQNKPVAPQPKESKRVWPPIARKSRKVDPKDLMAIPQMVKYGKAPAEGISSFVNGENIDIGGMTSGNVDDGVLADYLAEHDDPRESIIRKDLEYRNHPEGWAEGIIQDRQNAMQGDQTWYHPTHPVITGDDLLMTYQPMSRGSDSTHTPVIYRWNIYKGGNNHTGELTHSAMLTPEEHQKILQEFSQEGPEEPIPYSAYRAPAQGIVVRGTAYKGGSLIPNLDGEFANPRRKMSRKYRKYLKLEK